MNYLRNDITAPVLLLLLVLLGQVAWGQAPPQSGGFPLPEMPMTLDGVLGVGFAGGTGSSMSAGTITNGADSVYLVTDLTADGYYHDPRFLRFTVTPNFRWDWTGAADQHLNDGNQGMGAYVQFLGGSSTPIFFQYNLSRLTNSTLTSGVPISVESRGLTQDITVGTTFNRLHWPTFSFSVTDGSTENSVLGANVPSTTGSHFGYAASSTYNILGFRLTSNYSHSNNELNTPDLLNIGIPTKTHIDQQNEAFAVSRALPLKSNLDLSYTHSDSTSSLESQNTDLSYDMFNGIFTSNPTRRLSLTGSSSYNSNAGAQLFSQVLTGGSLGSATSPILSSGRELTFGGSATYYIGLGFQGMATAQHSDSTLSTGQEITFDSYGLGVGYARNLWGGKFLAVYTPQYYSVGERSPGVPTGVINGLMNTGSASYVRRAGRWVANASFTYSQANTTQTFALPINTRGVSGDLKASTRLAHEWNFSAGVNVMDSSYAGTNGTLGNTAYINVGNRTWTFSVQEQFGRGYTVATPYGLISVPQPTVPLLQTYYSTNRGLSGTATYARRRLIVTTVVSDASADIGTVTVPVSVGNFNFETKGTYKFRKLDVQAGYRMWHQTATSAGGLSQRYQSYWFEVLRSFHLF